MVIYIQDFLAHRRDAAPRAQSRLLAIAGVRVRPATSQRASQQSGLMATLVPHERGPLNVAPLSMADAMTLYAEASLI